MEQQQADWGQPEKQKAEFSHDIVSRVFRALNAFLIGRDGCPDKASLGECALVQEYRGHYIASVSWWPSGPIPSARLAEIVRGAGAIDIWIEHELFSDDNATRRGRDYGQCRPLTISFNGVGDEAAGADFSLVTHLERQRAFSEKTFGPGQRTKGVIDHIRKDLAEIEADPSDIMEWVDVIILAFDGAWRAGWEPEEIVKAIVAKQTKNEARQWPDWRSADPDKAIEHVRGTCVITPEAAQALRDERAELEAANEAASGHGAALTARHERIRAIDAALDDGGQTDG
jgi:hypothetical protein